ncbi:hypothetical protein DFH09DRAFT_1101835 [Mycena vulgaris]|nr:hypothetical protein DFH09DRAFT_1101835 [Mycena vulgaris]
MTEVIFNNAGTHFSLTRLKSLLPFNPPFTQHKKVLTKFQLYKEADADILVRRYIGGESGTWLPKRLLEYAMKEIGVSTDEQEKVLKKYPDLGPQDKKYPPTSAQTIVYQRGVQIFNGPVTANNICVKDRCKDQQKMHFKKADTSPLPQHQPNPPTPRQFNPLQRGRACKAEAEARQAEALKKLLCLQEEYTYMEKKYEEHKMVRELNALKNLKREERRTIHQEEIDAREEVEREQAQQICREQHTCENEKVKKN